MDPGNKQDYELMEKSALIKTIYTLMEKVRTLESQKYNMTNAHLTDPCLYQTYN